jgi:hypothetical protein
MPKGYAPGDILLAGLVFTSQTGAKRRRVMVISEDKTLRVYDYRGNVPPERNLPGASFRALRVFLG